jgi:hypothetical protein
METRDSAVDGAPGGSEAKAGSSYPERSKRFRFKERSRSQHSSGDAKEESTTRQRYRRRRCHTQSSHSSRKRRKTAELGGDDPSGCDDSTSKLPPETAFRESLWDAMGDDEGAAFWEGVYGQPIHTYPNTYQDPQTGELEQMTEEEYAQFVRKKMWEKSWEGTEAAKEEKRKEKEQEKRKIREEEKKQKLSDKTTSFGYRFDLEVENSLARGEQRREKRRWKGLWESYLSRWEDLQQLAKDWATSLADSENLFLHNKIVWPVETGKRKDVKPEEIESFIVKAIQATAPTDEIENVLIKALKIERVRWHPDKVQQRYGFMDVDESTMAGVTSTFQVFDRMWNQLRTKE